MPRDALELWPEFLFSSDAVIVDSAWVSSSSFPRSFAGVWGFMFWHFLGRLLGGGGAELYWNTSSMPEVDEMSLNVVKVATKQSVGFNGFNETSIGLNIEYRQSLTFHVPPFDIYFPRWVL